MKLTFEVNFEFCHFSTLVRSIDCNLLEKEQTSHKGGYADFRGDLQKKYHGGT